MFPSKCSCVQVISVSKLTKTEERASNSLMNFEVMMSNFKGS